MYDKRIPASVVIDNIPNLGISLTDQKHQAIFDHIAEEMEKAVISDWEKEYDRRYADIEKDLTDSPADEMLKYELIDQRKTIASFFKEYKILLRVIPTIAKR